MKIVEETLRQIIAFSEKQKAAQMRRLKAEGKTENTVTIDAYSSVISQLSSILPKDDPDKTQSEE